MASIHHPLLGPIRGNKAGDVVEFLGIPYATLAHQFASPVPIHYHDRKPEDIIQATSYGYALFYSPC